LVYTWTWRDAEPGTAGSVVTVVFRDDGGERTIVPLTHTGLTDPAEVPKHEHGWAAVIDTPDAKGFKAAVAPFKAARPAEGGAVGGPIDPFRAQELRSSRPRSSCSDARSPGG